MKNQDRLSTIQSLLKKEFGIVGSVDRVAGENENYLIIADNQSRYVLKVAEENHPLALIDLENIAVEAVAASCPNLELPRLVRTRKEKIAVSFYPEEESMPLNARLLHYVEGSAWFENLPVTTKRCRDFGRSVAQLDLAMSSIDSALAGHTHVWDLARAGQHRESTGVVENSTHRRLVNRAFELWAACAEPFFNDLPYSVIHSDLNDDNLRLIDGQLIGIIDFGDCLYNPTICNLAIALAYLLLDQKDPLALGSEFVAGYHSVRPLSSIEIEVLFPLILGRLATSVIISAQRRKIDPDRSAWFVTEDRAWRALSIYTQKSPVEAARILASATDVVVFKDVGLPKEELISQRKRHFSSALALSYKEPIKFVCGRGQYLFDEQGEPYLDLYNNVCHVGHCHPYVVKAACQQIAKLNTNTRYLYDNLGEYAERLCATMPSSLTHCFFVNSGSEANELALRLARVYTGNTDFVVVDNAYHGHTSTLIGISPYKFMGKGGSGKPGPGVHVTSIPDGYRGVYKGQKKEAGVAFGNEVRDIVRANKINTAGFISESLISCGGQVIPPEGYFSTVFDHVRKAGGVCILDEVQVGFGRTGTHFWAFETQGVVPDIVVMGKPMGNGHPIAAVVTTKEIAQSFADAGMEFFATYGGNPVSCAIGTAVLDVIDQEGLQEHAHEIGSYMLNGLRELKGRHSIIGDVRGIGLFLGIELVRDRTTLAPAAMEANAAVNALRQRRILTGTDGPFDNVIKIKPPMVISRNDVTRTIECLDEVLTSVCSEINTGGKQKGRTA